MTDQTPTAANTISAVELDAMRYPNGNPHRLRMEREEAIAIARWWRQEAMRLGHSGTGPTPIAVRQPNQQTVKGG